MQNFILTRILFVFYVHDSVPTQQFAQPNGVPAKITQQRRATVAMDSYTPGKRTLQRSQST